MELKGLALYTAKAALSAHQPSTPQSRATAAVLGELIQNLPLSVKKNMTEDRFARECFIKLFTPHFQALGWDSDEIDGADRALEEGSLRWAEAI